MSEELLNITKELSEKPTTELVLQFMELTADNIAKEKEIERLNNIINELEKEIISQIEICKEGQVLETKACSPFDTCSGDIRAYKYLLYKLKELKEE